MKPEVWWSQAGPTSPSTRDRTNLATLQDGLRPVRNCSAPLRRATRGNCCEQILDRRPEDTQRTRVTTKWRCRLSQKSLWQLLQVNYIRGHPHGSGSYEDHLKKDRLEDRTSLSLVKNINFLCHINVFGTAHQPTVQGSYDHS